MTANLLVLLGGAGIVQGFFVSFYILSTFVRRSLSNLLLLILNFSILIFLINTVYLFIRGGGEIELLSKVSLTAIALIGPLFFFYVKAFTHANYRFGVSELVQLAPVSLPIIAGTGFSKIHLTYIGAYIFIYLIISAVWLHRNKPDVKKRMWLYGLLLGLAGLAVLIAFFSFGKLCIISISIGFTVVSYTITYLGIRSYRDIFDSPREESLSVTKSISDSKIIFQQISDRMQNERLFQDPEVTLPKLALILNIHTHKLSFIINQVTGEGFSDYINRSRIKEAQRLLTQKDDKVAAIAFECGFNSLSTFYSVFKRYTGCSPAEFRAQARKADNVLT